MTTLNEMRHTCLLEAPPGAGKTTSLRSIPAGGGRRHFILSTEPGLPIVWNKPLDGWPLPPLGEHVHYKYLPPARPTFKELRSAALRINSMTIEQLQKQQMGIDKAAYDQFLQMIDALSNFTCDCCSKGWGPADEWTNKDTLSIDGLTGISTMSMDLTVGAKPVKTQPDWGVAMDNLERFISKCVFDTKCSFILLSHVDREKDEITGGTFITTKTLGGKLAPKLVAMFDEVILAKKTGSGFVWSNNEPNCDLKNRSLPLSNSLPPNFKALFRE